MPDLYRNPPLEYAMRAEIRVKGCSCCSRSVEVLKGAFSCPVDKKFPACQRDVKGFQYDEGDA
ncbi:MAG: hypothetical protein OEY66_07320 [Gammaproteobacteria bacterium]|nr:hypothetical protein [Gammaproteobacteria bacterium]